MQLISHFLCLQPFRNVVHIASPPRLPTHTQTDRQGVYVRTYMYFQRVERNRSCWDTHKINIQDASIRGSFSTGTQNHFISSFILVQKSVLYRSWERSSDRIKRPGYRFIVNVVLLMMSFGMSHSSYLQSQIGTSGWMVPQEWRCHQLLHHSDSDFNVRTEQPTQY